MMLLRTLVLERPGHDAPVNAALLCGFAVARISSNFLAYSLDEETEPGSARVYLAALRRNSERYFLGSIDDQEELQTAMAVFKQILTLAATAGVKQADMSAAEIPYHFVDLKNCKLPPARTEDHHSLTIKKALVMKVITLGTSVPGLPAIESSSLIVPSIRFSSQMVSPSVKAEHDTTAEPQVAAQEPVASPAVANRMLVEEGAVVAASAASGQEDSLFEVDSTLTSLARVAQELTQQKLAAIKQEEALEALRQQLVRDEERLADKDKALQELTQALTQREALLAEGEERLQGDRHQQQERAEALERKEGRLKDDETALHKRAEQLAALSARLPDLRNSMRDVLEHLDEALAGSVEP